MVFLKNTHRGFTLVELLVSISIFSLITVLVLVQNNNYNDNLLIGNLSYDIALSLRQAQVFGVSAREARVGLGDFSGGYGVYFVASDPQSYILFADKTSGTPGVFDIDSKEAIEVYSLGRGNYISDLCVTPSLDLKQQCTSTGHIKQVDISFKRPNPDAIIFSNGDTSSSAASAEIHISTPNGKERIISVSSVGQISIVNPNNP